MGKKQEREKTKNRKAFTRTALSPSLPAHCCARKILNPLSVARFLLMCHVKMNKHAKSYRKLGLWSLILGLHLGSVGCEKETMSVAPSTQESTIGCAPPQETCWLVAATGENDTHLGYYAEWKDPDRIRAHDKALLLAVKWCEKNHKAFYPPANCQGRRSVPGYHCNSIYSINEDSEMTLSVSSSEIASMMQEIKAEEVNEALKVGEQYYYDESKFYENTRFLIGSEKISASRIKKKNSIFPGSRYMYNPDARNLLQFMETIE